VAVLMGKKMRKLAVTVKSSTENSVSACSDFMYEIRNGELALKRAYHME